MRRHLLEAIEKPPRIDPGSPSSEEKLVTIPMMTSDGKKQITSLILLQGAWPDIRGIKEETLAMLFKLFGKLSPELRSIATERKSKPRLMVLCQLETVCERYY